MKDTRVMDTTVGRRRPVIVMEEEEEEREFWMGLSIVEILAIWITPSVWMADVNAKAVMSAMDSPVGG